MFSIVVWQKCKFKTIIRFHNTHIRMAKKFFFELLISRCWWGCGITWILIPEGDAKCSSLFRGRFGRFFTIKHPYHVIELKVSLVFTQIHWKHISTQKPTQSILWSNYCTVYIPQRIEGRALKRYFYTPVYDNINPDS